DAPTCRGEARFNKSTLMIRLLPVGGIQRSFSTVSIKNGCGGRSTGTSAVPQIADEFGEPRKSAALGGVRAFSALPSGLTRCPLHSVQPLRAPRWNNSG